MSYDEKQCAKDQNQTEGEVRQTWHQARDDSGVREGKDKEELDNFEPPTGSGSFVGDILLFPLRIVANLFKRDDPDKDSE